MIGSKLTFLFFGAGQDSSALLEMLLDDKVFRDQYAPNDFLVLMSDTGDEFDATYKHVRLVQTRCVEAGVEFVFLTSDMGYHSPNWKSRFLVRRIEDCVGGANSVFSKRG